jgi:dTDP-4-amino-4,6-dideoxygalactose transaminase
VLVDVDPTSGNLDPDDLKKRLTPKSKAIIVVHLFGLPANLSEIVDLGLPVIEDCAQALGSALDGEKVGTCGQMAIFSFYATKLITTGEGGMLLSHDPALLTKARDLRDYDKKDSFVVRFNYKMTDLQAAIGRSQLRKLETFLQERDKLARVYNQNLVSQPCTLPPAAQGRIYYRYVISVEHNVSNLIQILARENIQAARPVYRPLHRYLNLERYPGAELAWNSQISLPIYPSLVAEEVQQICQALQRFFENECR